MITYSYLVISKSPPPQWVIELNIYKSDSYISEVSLKKALMTHHTFYDEVHQCSVNLVYNTVV